MQLLITINYTVEYLNTARKQKKILKDLMIGTLNVNI